MPVLVPDLQPTALFILPPYEQIRGDLAKLILKSSNTAWLYPPHRIKNLLSLSMDATRPPRCLVFVNLRSEYIHPPARRRDMCSSSYAPGDKRTDCWGVWYPSWHPPPSPKSNALLLLVPFSLFFDLACQRRREGVWVRTTHWGATAVPRPNHVDHIHLDE